MGHPSNRPPARRPRSRASSAVVLGLLLAACATLVPAPDAGLPIQELDTEARPVDLEADALPAIGPVIQVATGEVNGARFHFGAYRGVDGVCLWFDWENGGSGGCGFAPGEAPFSDVFGVMSLGGDGVTQDVTGLVAVHVDTVWIELRSGARARAALLPLDAAGIDANAFMAFLPLDAAAVAIVALDGDGGVIERFELGPAAPPPADGPDPTPAAP